MNRQFSTMRSVVRSSICVLSAVLLLGVAGCATIPSSSTPDVVSSYAASPSLDNVPTPHTGQAPDLLLRSFFSAAAHPLNNHQAAREFLTGGAAEAWQDATSTLVLDRIDLNADGAATGSRMSYTVRGTVIGGLETGGAFRAANRPYEETVELVFVDGDWRIDQLPSGVVMDRRDFTSTYQARDIYFLNPTRRYLVPDRRWTYSRQQNKGSALVSLLAAGPRDQLANGVVTALPTDVVAQATSEKDGIFTVELSGLAGMSAENLRELAAQLIWTLADSDVRGPYRILADGAPVSTGAVDSRDTWTTDDVREFNPAVLPNQPLFALRDGALVQVGDTEATVVAGWTSSGRLESATVSPNGGVAAVTGHGDEERSLVVGTPDDTPVTAVSAGQISRPSWTTNGLMLYAVADGRRVLRWGKAASGGLTETVIDSRALNSLGLDNPVISEFVVSRDGARAAMIVNGRLYVSVLENTGGVQSDTGPRLGTLVPVATNLGDTAVSVGWRPDGALLVGTRANDTPVWVVEIDGSEQIQLTARNVTAPVVAVSSTRSTEYILDGRALLQIDYGVAGFGETATFDDFWREVPALQGARAVPVTVR